MMRLCVLAALLGFAVTADATDAAASLPLKPCRLEHPARMLALSAECASITVAEDPDKPKGRTIELFVALVPAISLNKKPDPLFLIAGGPGTSAVDLYTSSSGPFERVRRDRDIILVDQRGTGRSHRLDCDYGEMNVFERIDEIEVGPANIKCRDDLSAKADLRLYTTSVAVGDLELVREKLGYARINLYGNSYGTRVAQHYARRYPKSTRTVILDGVVNPEVVLGPAIAIDAEHALERILKRCSGDTACAKAFADPAADYRMLRARLTATPEKTMVSDAATGRPINFAFTSRHLSAVLRFASYNDDQAALLPLSLHLATHEGNFTPLASQFRVFANSLVASFAYGMHNSVACSEDAPLIDPTTLDLAALNATHMGAEQVQQLIEACKDWPKGVVDEDLHASFKSDAAALLLSGADDPVTPPKYAALAQRAFADSKHVIVAGHGHGQLGAPCVDRIIANFVMAGTARGLDSSCTDRLKPMPFFITLAGPAP
ncbi:MAG TPA: alpha/beta fold hydrolase [Steroidobacteraceae bacterium]|nr:alpha/beta fold hydrolase [Steroidobacteraceae bacterium]